jgi:hypothetical protein
MFIARERVGKQVPAEMKTYGTTEKLPFVKCSNKLYKCAINPVIHPNPVC